MLGVTWLSAAPRCDIWARIAAVQKMKHPSENESQEALAGHVERVTYHNVENGFCVLRAKARGHRDVVTVVGHAATMAAGEWITASGEWVTIGHTASSSKRATGHSFGASQIRGVRGTTAITRKASVA